MKSSEPKMADTTKGSLYNTPKEDPNWGDNWTPENIRKYKDEVYTKITELLLEKWTQIEPYIDGNGIEALQKTYRDGRLVTGKTPSDILVIYESDVDANIDDEKIEGAILDFMNFVDVSLLSLRIVPMVEITDEQNVPELWLDVEDRSLNISEIIGT